MKALPMNASNFPLGILLLAAGLVLLLREHRSSVLEVEVLELRRKLSAQRDSTSSSTMENERSLRSGPKRVPPQPPYPLTELDLERRSSTRPDHDNAGGDSGGSRSSGIAASSAALLPYVVPKKTFSDDTRLVFFAGIEGTGHHFWTAVFDDEQVGALATPDVDEFGPVGELWQLAKQGPQLCNKACDNANGDKASASGGGVVHSPKALKKSIADLVGKLSAATSSQPVTTTVVPLNAWKSRGTVKSSEGSFSSSGSDGAAAAAAVLGAKPAKKRGGKASLVPEESRYGMMSFPNWWEPEKTLKHPNLRLLSEASEAAEADLRVVVLLRNSKDVLHSTAVKRASAGGFSLPLGREAAILADNTAVLMAQLQLLDPSFYVCVEMDALEDDSFEKVGRFIGITGSGRGDGGSGSAWSLSGLVARGLSLPARRPQGKGFTEDMNFLASKALAADPETPSDLLPGFEPFTEAQAITSLADLLAMELLFRKTICGM